MDSRDEYPYYTEAAFRMQNKRHPTVPLDEAMDELDTGHLTVLQYLAIYHQDLNNEEMAIVALRVDGGLSYADLAECLGVAEATAFARIQKILERILA